MTIAFIGLSVQYIEHYSIYHALKALSNIYCSAVAVHMLVNIGFKPSVIIQAIMGGRGELEDQNDLRINQQV